MNTHASGFFSGKGDVMSAAETFVWGLEGAIGIEMPISEAIAGILDGSVDLISLAELGADFASGVTDVLEQMQTENQQRLKLEQEWITQIRDEREKTFNTINAYIASLAKLSETDRVLERLSGIPGATEQMNSLIQKRENRTQQIRELRDRAARSRDIDEIAACAERAETIFEGLQGEIQAEIIFFAKHGVSLEAYGSLHDDAIAMALARQHEVAAVWLQSLEEDQNITQAMIQYDITVFEDSLSEFLCEEGLNDRQLRDLMAIRQDLVKIERDETISLSIKKKRLAALFTTYTRREQGIKAELAEMQEYYDTYLKETYDIPDERLEMADFDSIDEIAAATREAKSGREERLQKQYVQMQMDRIMKKHGFNIVESAVMGRKEDDQRVLYGIDESTAVDVFVSDKGMVSTRVVGVNFGDTPTDAQEDQLVQKEHKFCSKMKDIEADLEDVGIVLRRKKVSPPDREASKWIQLDQDRTVQKSRIVRRKRRQTDHKVMYME